MSSKVKGSVVEYDYELESVPQSARKSFYSITAVWIGYVILITSMMAGGGLAVGLSFKEVIVVTILGNIFLSCLAISVSYIASKTGLTFALITRYSFGLEGSRIASIFGPIINMGWFTVQSALYGHFIAKVLGLSHSGENIAMILSAVVMGVFALIGIEALTILGYVAIPAIFFLCIATVIKGVGTIDGGVVAVWNSIPIADKSMTLVAGVTTVVGTWIFAASTGIADIMRYSRSVKEAATSTFLGLVIGNSFMLLCGAITAITSQEADLTEVLFKFGLVFPSFILITTNLFTTNGTNMYSNALGMSNVFRRFSSKSIMLILITICAFATLSRPYEIDKLFTFLGMLAMIVPPLPGIILADFFIINKMKYGTLDEIDNIGYNMNAILAWIVGTGSVFALNAIGFGFAPLNGIVIGGGVYVVLTKLGVLNNVGYKSRVTLPQSAPTAAELARKARAEVGVGPQPRCSESKLGRCKTIAMCGVLVMGVGSFIACLAIVPSMIMVGNVLLGLSIFISAYGFIYWRP